MSELRHELERLEGRIQRLHRRLVEVESRLDLLAQAALENAVDLRQLGEAVSPLKEKESSESP